jgi:hypothetical protein
MGTVKASSLQPYQSTVNGFFKGHGLKAFALGDLVAKVRKGLATSHIAIEYTPIRVHLLASIVIQALRLKLMDPTTGVALQTSPTRDQV